MIREQAEQIARKHALHGNGADYFASAVDAILESVAIQKQRDAELCRRLQVESRKRVELGFTCAKAIEEQDDE